MFLPGFLFIKICNWINDKKTDFTEITIWSLIITFIIKIFYSFINSFFMLQVNNPIKIFIYLITCMILPFLLEKILISKFILNIFNIKYKKTFNKNIFKDVISRKENIIMKIFLKSSENYYIGKYVIRNDNESDSYIGLINYDYGNNNELLFESSQNDLNSLILFRLDDIERLEILYEDNSIIWNNFFKEDF